MGGFTGNITIVLYHPRSSWFQNHINGDSAELDKRLMLYFDGTILKKCCG